MAFSRADAMRSVPAGCSRRWYNKKIHALAVRDKLDPEEARVKLLGEKQPSLEFTVPEELGALNAFLCSDAAAQLSRVALPVDGGWLAR